MEHAISIDGTPIAFERSGHGPPLILIHGAVTDRRRWGALAPLLEPHFTVCAVDRRGRGDSGDGPDYAFELEIADVIAVANALGGDVNIYGHSSGATFALMAAPQIENLHRLVLYEPALGDILRVPTRFIDQLQHMLDAGEDEDVIVTFLREGPKMPQHEIDHLRTLPQWKARVATAPTVPRELRAAGEFRFDPASLQQFTAPTLFLLGSDSPETIKQGTEIARAALPASDLRMLPGQQHLADVTAPDLIARELIAFLK
jgi:pimeloyl-ACP methyl ester carboxylesterase